MSFLYPIFLLLAAPVIAIYLTKERKNIVFYVNILILLLVTISLAQPVLKKEVSKGTIEAKDIVMAVDISRSMDAEDISPTRYQYAKEVIADLLKSSQGNNISLFAFTTNALLLSPPTTDHRLIEVALKSIQREYILTKGTSLEKLFLKVGKLKMNKKPLILLTDGGEEENLNRLIEVVNSQKIHLIVLALGTKSGTTITTNTGEALKNKANELVISRINPLLKTLASRTGGAYMEASHTAKLSSLALAEALKQYYTDEALASKYIDKKEYRYRHLYQIFLLIAALLFLMLHTSAVKYLFLFFSFLGIEAHASSVSDLYHLDRAYDSYHSKEYARSIRLLDKIDQPSLQSIIALANSYYKTEDYKRALSTYLSIKSSSKTIKKNLFYNIGNCYTQLKKYDKAILYYRRSLTLGFDEEAKNNLLFVRQLKETKKGISFKKAQGNGSTKSGKKGGNKENKGESTSSSSSSASASGEKGSKNKTNPPLKKHSHKEEVKHPLGSKVYDLVNKGYINEKKPW